MNNSQDSSFVPSGALVRRLLLEAVLPYSARIAAAVVFMVVAAATTAALAWLMDPVVNRVFVERRAALLWPVGLSVLCVFVLKGLATYAQTVIMTRVGQTILMDMQNRLFSHLIRMDLSFFHDHKTGALISHFTTDINAMRQAVSTALTGIGKDSLSLIFLIAVMFYQDWRLAAISFVIFPATVVPITTLGQRLRKVTANTQEQTASYMTLLQQTFSGIRLIKSYRMEDYEADRASVLTVFVRDLVVRAERVRALASPVMETLGGLAVTVVVIYGGWRVIQGETTAGAFFSFITALLMAYRPMKALANLNAQVQEGLAGAQRIFAVLDKKPEIKEKEGALPLSVTKGAITFQAVDFSYDDQSPALCGVSFSASPGKTTALVGPSGAGKSTILNLIPRFYDVGSGSIRIDDQDIANVTLASLRSHIALVGQDVILFDDSIRANIRFGRPTASDEEVEAAARAAAAHKFISELGDGYDTIIGERGQSLSGGQRQRLAIARAILMNAPILILDEATSALDTGSEQEIQQALSRLTADRTTIVIAHRLSTIIAADLIHVVSDGRIVESGIHQDLLGRQGIYASLHSLQYNNTDGEVTGD